MVSKPEEWKPLERAYVPMAGLPESGPRSASRARRSSATSAARLIALLPIAQMFLVAAHVLALRGSTTWVFLWFVLAVGLVGSYVLARVDHEELRRRGFDQHPSPLWALALPIAYLAIRANRVGRSDWDAHRPFWLYVGSLALIVVVMFAVTFWATVASQL